MDRSDNAFDPEFDGDEFDDNESGNGDDDSPLSEEELAFFNRPIWEVLGIKHEFAADDLAPQVDLELLRAVAREELSKADTLKIFRLIWSFQSWYDAWGQVQKTPGLFVLPWERHPSIYEHIKAHFGIGHLGLVEGGEILPDSRKFPDDREIVEAGGDDVMAAAFSSSEQATEIFDLVRSYCETPRVENKSILYRRILGYRTIHWVQEFMELLSRSPQLNLDRLYGLARSLTTQSPDREPVKFGLAVLANLRPPQDVHLFRTLARHDELTRHCLPGLMNLSEDPEQELWQLARNVFGWGRIHAIEELENTNDPEIQEWLTREGYQNSVCDGHTAILCATTGRLRAVLERDDLDDARLVAAGDLVTALFVDWGHDGIEGYDDGVAVVERYLELMETRASSLPDLLMISELKDCLEIDDDFAADKNDGRDEDDDRSQDDSRGVWTDELRMRLAGRCAAIIGRSSWRGLVFERLRSDDDDSFDEADNAAGVIGIDTWEICRNRVLASPKNPARWERMCRHVDERRIAELIDLTVALLPLDSLAQPADEGLDESRTFLVESCLDLVLIILGRFPGHGVEIVKAGLQSAVPLNRVRALRALSKWGRDRWPPGIERILKDLRAVEPHNQVRLWIDGALTGKSWAILAALNNERQSDGW